MAREFDGSGDVLDAGASTIFDQATSISVGGWLWIDDNDASYKPAHQWGGANSAWLVEVNTTGTIQIVIQANNGDTRVVRSNGTLSNGAWHHVLLTWAQPTAVTIYIDGVAQGLTVSVAGNPAQIRNASTNLMLGKGFAGDGGDLDGRMAEWAFWRNRVLIASEVASLAKGFSPLFYPRDLIEYVKITGRDSPEIGLLGEEGSFTVTNTTYVEHPRMIYPSATSIRRFTTAAAVVGGATDWPKFQKNGFWSPGF